MKTIIDTATKVSIHLLPDDDTRSFSDLQVTVDAVVINGVSIPPGNYYGYKYKYIDGGWVADETYIDPDYSADN
jgi:hypothetical protein|tara:strand:- start:67 stop:288 length:222 start_codon:yes stop_codon:yes gene_type:complete